MKLWHRLATLFLTASLPLALLVVTAEPALAAVSVTVSPDEGMVDSLVHVSGTGFTPGSTFRTYFAYDTDFETVSIGIVAGDGTIAHFLTVPEAPGGSYEVRVQTAHEYSSDYFTVEPSLELSQTSVIVDENLYVYGKGFRASRGITVKFDNQTMTTTATDSKGSFSAIFRVPESELGSHEVTAYDNIYRLTTRLSVTQSISITPERGPTGSKVTVIGTGFRDERDITISFDDEEVATSPSAVTSDENGSFTASFYVPTCLNRNPEIRASDGRYTAEAEFTILANISLSTDAGSYRDTITVTGTGFRSSRVITMTFDDDGLITSPVTVRSDNTGCFEVEFEVPEGTSGAHTIEASDGTNSDSASLNVLPGIDLSPTSGPIGVEVTVSGTGFGANKVVTIRFAQSHVRTAASDIDGSFTDYFKVPQNSSGNYTISANDGLVSAEAIFTITTSTELEPDTGHVGTLITITGTGFAGAVTIQYDETVAATTSADANGAFTVSFPAPTSQHGHHSVTASDSFNTITATFTMESEAPPVPALTSPENGARQSSRPAFSWEAVSDPSGVSYRLQIAPDNSFSTLLLEKQGLTQPQYTLAREEGLQTTDRDTPYYWRVRAVDGASNESDWSTPRSFFVSFIPQWGVYVLIVAISVAISVLVSRKVWHKGGSKSKSE
ncbi:MAG: IPT/TIG domain-containing protein [Dehalococcoidales bacterium]|nr:IPT/TIG domain-containing protein [Dehalococcoidales bacterium]